MNRIRVLDDLTINKIAAGEVIENPASVVKELIENALDAGSTEITIEIAEGGRQLIRITDNGCGMSGDDALLCLERHATSKIHRVEDIETIATMGFRGEAIPSIAAISKFSILTAPNEPKNEKGTYVIVEGGRILSHQPAARSHGTTIEVKSLFYNVPVRRKFQKSPVYDAQEIQKLVGLLAIAHPTVQFECISDKKTVFKTSVSFSDAFLKTLGQRIESVFGKDYYSSLIPIEFKKEAFECIGYLGLPTSHKPNRASQHLFINERLVTSPLISFAIKEGYGTMLPNNRYPIYTLHLRMPGTHLDVNVHPQKKEVRLRNEFDLKQAIIDAVQKGFRKETPSIHHTIEIPPSPSIPPFWGKYPLVSEVSEVSESPSPLFAAEDKWQFTNTPPTILKEKHDEIQLPLAPSTKKPAIIATIFGFCILDSFQLNSKLIVPLPKNEGGLCLLNQQLAYSRIHYEMLKKKSSHSQQIPLLIPLTISLNSHEFQTMQYFADDLNGMGFGLREFGENLYLIDAYPSFLKEKHIESTLRCILADLVDRQFSRKIEKERDEQLALIACKATLPPMQRLSLEEAASLLAQLIGCDVPSECPLGKPTCHYIEPSELIKWFKR